MVQILPVSVCVLAALAGVSGARSRVIPRAILPTRVAPAKPLNLAAVSQMPSVHPGHAAVVGQKAWEPRVLPSVSSRGSHIPGDLRQPTARLISGELEAESKLVKFLENSSQMVQATVVHKSPFPAAQVLATHNDEGLRRETELPTNPEVQELAAHDDEGLRTGAELATSPEVRKTASPKHLPSSSPSVLSVPLGSTFGVLLVEFLKGLGMIAGMAVFAGMAGLLFGRRARASAAGLVEPNMLTLGPRRFTAARASARLGTSFASPAFAGIWKRQASCQRAGRLRGIGRQALGKDFELPPDAVVEAVGRAGQRVTVADVAAAGGLSLAEARQGVVALAASLGAEANLEVSKEGEIVYLFPADVKAALSNASSAAAAREAWNQAKPALFTALRIAFGLALFASIAIIYTAIFVISVSGSSDRDDRDDRRRDDGMFSGGGFGFGPSLYFGPSPFDLFFYRPYYSYGGYAYYDEWDPRPQDRPPKMGFLEAVYSFVFGDGDPNEGREQRCLAAVAAAARRNGGVLTAEQLAPLIEPPAYKAPDSITNVDESWVLPTLAGLNGRPEVAASGQIVYVFDDLQTTAAEDSGRSKPPPILKEQEIPFSLADEGQLGLVGLLGVANLLGAAYLGAQLPRLALQAGFIGGVQFLFPALLAYAIGFFAAPAFRYFTLGKTNSEIEERNRNREQWLNVLRSGDVDGKLAVARSYSTRMRQIDQGDTVYSTGKDATSQATASELDDFDRKLKGS